MAGGGTASGPGLLHEGLRRLRRRREVGRQDPPRGQDGDPRRRPSGRPRVHRFEGARRAEGLGADRSRLRPELHGRGLRLRLLPERQPQRPRHGRLHARGRAGPGVDDPRRGRRRADGHLQGPRHLPQDGRGRAPLRRPGHPVRHDDQRLAHVREHGSHPREQPVLRVHVPQRHGLQPGLTQPHEVRRRGRRVRSRGVSIRGQGDADGAGDPGRQRLLPDAQDRGELAQVPPARPRLREPRRAADEPRPRLRLGRGAQLRRGPHRDHARRGVQAVGDHRPRPRRPVRRVQDQRGAVPARHRQAPRRRVPHPHPGRARRPSSTTPRSSTTRRSSSARSTAIATRRSPCSRPPARSPS